ncbi:MAG: flavodoxin-dependent (E)-4-hydroxy-3-methylbut-2-enyl-diphosphate synthase [Candidatus Saelkia tenebricola]|nr:flavodoxin-dependent (E)-4-hydroxy-3-methylbut-2-enyl-diphosphate synthase [Candidatus Saelkia tenebricola]
MKKTRIVRVADLKIGGNNPVIIQSMIKTPLKKVGFVLNTISKLKKEGCEIIRVAYKEEKEAKFVKSILKESLLPVEVDIHFASNLAIDAIKFGADAVRINPGNVRKQELKNLIDVAKAYSVPIRVGVNSGSIPAKYKNKSNAVSGMVCLMKEYLEYFQKQNFKDIMLSLKSNSVRDTYYANMKVASLFNYPIHLGVTATGLGTTSIIKSSVGIGALLLQGIGDTIRVSYTGSPLEEVRTAKMILSAVNLRKFAPEIISCPGCSRLGIDVIKLAREAQSAINKMSISKPLKIAIMGCEVNGPGEAEDADIGIAGGKNCAILFKKGKIVKKVSDANIISVLMKEVKDMAEER